MKIIFNSKYGEGAWHMLRLLKEGHEVDYYCSESERRDILCNLIPPSLTSPPDYGKYDLSIFDMTGSPKEAEKSLLLTPTIGDGNLNCELEDNRAFGIEVMEQVGIKVPSYEFFSSIEDAIAYIQENNKAFVFKSDGKQASDITYVSSSSEDLLEYIETLGERTKGASFILQEVIKDGVEISCEGWFDGKEFRYHNYTLEEKKFMNDNCGPNTGCSATLMWWAFGSRKIFNEGLGKMKDFLAEYNFKGMIDLNCIIKDDKLYGLEWTPRFGYDSSATLFALVEGDNVGKMLFDIASGEYEYDVPYKFEFAASVRLSIPPYPNEFEDDSLYKECIPIKGITPEDVGSFYLYDAMLQEDRLMTCGQGFGNIGCPIKTAPTIEGAFNKVYAKIKELKIPNLQYRTDACESIKCRYDRLVEEGWL